MKRAALFVAVTLAALGIILASASEHGPRTAQAQEKAGAWKGEIVDLACYLTKGAKGEDHKKCAEAGQPLALLTADGKLSVLVGALGDAKKLVGAEVEVKGKALERSGVRGVEVDSVAAQGRKTEPPPRPSEGSR